MNLTELISAPKEFNWKMDDYVAPKMVSQKIKFGNCGMDLFRAGKKKLRQV